MTDDAAAPAAALPAFRAPAFIPCHEATDPQDQAAGIRRACLASCRYPAEACPRVRLRRNSKGPSS